MALSLESGDGHGSLRQADGEADRGGGAPAEQPATLRPSGRQARCNFLLAVPPLGKYTD